MASRVTASEMSPQQVEVFARGLYHLSAVDGADESETALIRKFLADAGYDRPIEALATGTFDPAEAGRVLDTEELRRTFLRAGVALLRADGDISDEEFTALRAVATAFEQKQILIALLSEAPGAAIF